MNDCFLVFWSMNWFITIYWTLYNNTMLCYCTLEHISDSSCHFYMALKPFTRKWPESFGLLGHTSKWAVREYICTLVVVVVVSCIVPMGKFFQVPGQEFCTMKSKKHQYSKKLLVLIFSSYFGILMLSME